MISDRGLQEAVLARLDGETRVTAAHLGVTAERGVVSIFGHVDSYGDRHAAESVVRRVEGVKAVVVAIEVRLSKGHRRGDDDIAKAALGGLVRQAIDERSIAIRVEKGWVTLSGQVAESANRAVVEVAVRRVQGVAGLTNQVTVAPKVRVADVSADIAQALHRSWFFDFNPIQVSAEGGTVRLTGEVGSSAQRDVACSRAWAALGVTQVQNLLRVAGESS